MAGGQRGPSRVSAPAVVIRLELERAPVLYFDCLNEGEEKRLHDWITARWKYAELVQQAAALILEAKAA